MSGLNVVRALAALAFALMATAACAGLATYHVTAVSLDEFGNPTGFPVGLQFTVDDTTPPVVAPDHVEYQNVISSGFLRAAGAVYPLDGFNVISLWDDQGPPGGTLLDLFQLFAVLAPGPDVPGFGQPETIVLLMGTFAPAPTPPLNGTGLDGAVLPASAFEFSTFQVNIVNDGSFLALIIDGPIPGPLPASEPPAIAGLLAAAFALAISERTRRRQHARIAMRPNVEFHLLARALRAVQPLGRSK
jgi:hypothetical protein